MGMQKIMRVMRMFRFCQRLRVMLCLILFVVAVCFTEGSIEYLQSDERESLKYYKDIDYRWGSLMRCVYSLYIAMCSGISWGELAEPLFEVSPWLGGIFLLYV